MDQPSNLTTSRYWTVDPPHEDYRCQAVSRSEEDTVAGFRAFPERGDERDLSELQIERVE